MAARMVVLRVPRVGDLDERPAAEAAVVVDGRHPQRARRGDLGGLVLLRLAGDLDDQVQQVVGRGRRRRTMKSGMYWRSSPFSV